MKNKIGIFGGTFNPIHLGHLIVANETREILNLDQIVFVPANLPPHKNTHKIADARHRLEMIKIAISNNNNFIFSAIEMDREGPSYTIDTLKIFKKMYQKTEFYFMIGADNLKEIKYWKDPEGILKLVNLVILVRPGFKKYINNYKKYFNFLSSKKLIKKIKIIRVSEIDISSSSIRKRIIENKSINYLVSEKVKEYIIKNKLYKKRGKI